MNIYKAQDNTEPRTYGTVVRAPTLSYPTTTSSPLARLPSSVSRIGELASRVGVLADRLCGSVPTAVENDGAAKPAGVFAEIGESADTLNQYASRIEEALARIEAQLP
jgi:hypothetical protein